jgi:acetyl esterase/lipase
MNHTSHLVSPARWILALCVLCSAGGGAQDAAAAPPPVLLWPERPPGETTELGPETDTTKPTDNLIAGRRLIRLGNVFQPSIQIFKPPQGSSTGASVLVCPGGGYHILALDLEGTEVCDWLTKAGITAVLLKYRVPRRPNLPPHLAPLQDAQRAMGLLRQRAGELEIDPNRIGVLGFSAGGHLAAVLSTTRKRAYERIDAADDLDPRPNFTVLIYPGYLVEKVSGGRISPELQITAETPPTFLAMTQDDPVGADNALHYALALHAAKVPFSLHLYPTGGHGYGLRRTDNPVTTWPDRVLEWLTSGKWLAQTTASREPAR